MTKKNQLRQLYTDAFSDSKNYVDFFFRRKYRGKNAVYEKQDGKIVSALHLFYRNTVLRGAILRSAFVSSASTAKNLRGKRIFEKVMRKTLLRLKREKIAFVSLNPFRHTYYSKFGFVTYTYAKKIAAAHSEAESTRLSANVRSLQSIYSEQCGSYGCYDIRTASDFKKLLEGWSSDGLNINVYLKNGKRCYVVFDAISNVAEEFCGDIDALAGSGLSLTAELPLGNDENNMARIVCLKSCLENITYEKDGQITFAVRDSFFSENEGIFKLTVQKGRGKLVASKEKPEREYSIEELTLIVLGLEKGFDGLLNGIRAFTLDKY